MCRRACAYVTSALIDHGKHGTNNFVKKQGDSERRTPFLCNRNNTQKREQGSPKSSSGNFHAHGIEATRQRIHQRARGFPIYINPNTYYEVYPREVFGPIVDAVVDARLESGNQTFPTEVAGVARFANSKVRSCALRTPSLRCTLQQAYTSHHVCMTAGVGLTRTRTCNFSANSSGCLLFGLCQH